ncbi:MAG: hypothetical protein PUJ51_19215 [Clostridiales bacterium]|nr:hypothetical protein [Clostridiales bacterium]
MDNKNKEIRTINVEGITYDITDPNVPEWVKSIAESQIEKWDNANDYELNTNKPSINSIELSGDKDSDSLGLQDKMDAMSNFDIENLLG